MKKSNLPPSQFGENRRTVPKTSGADDPRIAFQKAIAAYQGRKFEEVEHYCAEVIKRLPQHVDALHMLGLVKAQRAQFSVAVDLFKRAIKLQPANATFHALLGRSFVASGRPGDALTSLDEALRLKSDLLEAAYDKGTALIALGRLDEAVVNFDEVLKRRPGAVDVLYNRGTALLNLGRFTEALENFDAVLTRKPDSAEAHNNRGATLRRMNRSREALDSFDLALRYRPHHVPTLINRGAALQDLSRFKEAVDCFDEALRRDPQSVEALYNRSDTRRNLKRYDLAIEDLESLLAISPKYDYAPGYLLYAKLSSCDWAGMPELVSKIEADLRKGLRCATPFIMVSASQSSELALVATEIYVADKCPAKTPLWQSERYQHEKIRLAYLSADFHSHATAYLMAELFETHDSTRFETMAVSFGPSEDGPMRKRLEAAFDRFVDVREMSDFDVAQFLRNAEIDIAIDLKGHTHESRPGILAHRPAPIQINYLGFPGTMAASYIDYLIADHIVTPPGSERFYREKIVRLPGSYQVNDRSRLIAATSGGRMEHHLPEQGFVFCCFNNSFKILPEIFAIWMRLLASVEGSVLWLLEDSQAAMRNLRAAALKHGISQDRLIFAQRIPLQDHLARHAYADLFLDTLPYNAHTTASDALWAGLPVLTCAGESFASRVAASLLMAVGLPELVTDNLADYEALALKLATEQHTLAALREQLAQNRLTTPLFDTQSFRQHIEAAYVTMWKRYENGLPAEAFDVPLQMA